MNSDLLCFVQNFAMILPPKGQGKGKHIQHILDACQNFDVAISCELAEYVCTISCIRWWLEQVVVVLALNIRYVELMDGTEQCLQTPEDHPWLMQLEYNDSRYRTLCSTVNFKLMKSATSSALRLKSVDDIVDLQRIREASYPVNDNKFFDGANIRENDVTEQIRWLRAVQELFQRYLPRVYGGTGFDTTASNFAELKTIHGRMVNEVVKAMFKPIPAGMVNPDMHSIQGYGSVEEHVDSAWLEREAEELKLKRGKHFPPVPGYDPNRPWESQRKSQGRRK